MAESFPVLPRTKPYLLPKYNKNRGKAIGKANIGLDLKCTMASIMSKKDSLEANWDWGGITPSFCVWMNGVPHSGKESREEEGEFHFSSFYFDVLRWRN